MPVKIDLNKVIWTVQKPEVAEVYENFRGKCCFNDNENCNELKVCKCEPCHRCGNALCVCPLVNEPYHDICGPQLSCWCQGVEELDMNLIVVGEPEEQGGPRTSSGNEQGGSGPSNVSDINKAMIPNKQGGQGTSPGLLNMGKFKYTTETPQNTENIFLGPQGGGGWETVGKKGKTSNKGSNLTPPIPFKRSRDDPEGRGASNIVNPVRLTRETEMTERGEKVTIKDSLGNVEGSYLKDEVFEETVYNEQMWTHYKNLHNKVIVEEINRVKDVVNKEVTGYIQIPWFQPGTVMERLTNIYQSFARVTIPDPALGRERTLRLEGSDWDLRVQETNAEAMFLITCRTPEILKYIGDLQTVKYFKKLNINNKFLRGGDFDDVVKEHSIIKIHTFKNPSRTYLATGAVLDRLDDYVNSLKTYYNDRMGNFYNITVVPERKQITIYKNRQFGETTINACTGNIRVTFTQKTEAVSCTKTPHEGKFFLEVRGNNRQSVTVEMRLRRLDGPRRCHWCKGADCERERCKNQCRYCHIDLQENNHLESECSKLCPTAALVKNNKRLSYRIQEFNDYLAEKPKDIPIDIWENEEALTKINTDTEKEKSSGRISYLDIVKGAHRKGVERAELNKKDRDNQTKIADLTYEKSIQGMFKRKVKKMNRGFFGDNNSLKDKTDDEVIAEQLHSKAAQIIQQTEGKPPKKPSSGAKVAPITEKEDNTMEVNQEESTAEEVVSIEEALNLTTDRVDQANTDIRVDVEMMEEKKPPEKNPEQLSAASSV